MSDTQGLPAHQKKKKKGVPDCEWLFPEKKKKRAGKKLDESSNEDPGRAFGVGCLSKTPGIFILRERERERERKRERNLFFFLSTELCTYRRRH